MGISGGKIRYAEVAYLVDYFARVIFERSLPPLLDKGVDLTLDKFACVIYINGDKGCIAANSCKIHAVGGAEVAETIHYYMTVVNLHRPDDMRSVTIYYVGAGIDCGTCESLNISAFVAERLPPWCGARVTLSDPRLHHGRKRPPGRIYCRDC